MTSGGTMNQGRICGALCVLLAMVAINASADSVPGQYVVKLKSATNIMSAGNLEKALNAKIKRTISSKLGLVVIQRPMVETVEGAMQVLTHNPMIEVIEPNYIYRVNGAAKGMPSEAQIGNLWGLKNTGQTVIGDAGTITGKPGIDIEAEKAWAIETGSNNVLVAVVDTGVDYKNPVFAGNIFTNQTELNGQLGIDDDGNGCIDDIHGCDFVENDGDPMDVYGHGTHVSGTIAANGNNGSDIVGVAWNATILPVRFLDENGSGTLDNAILAVEYATKMKVNISNNSWGGGPFSQLLLEAIQRTKDAGILFVSSAGNSGVNIDIYPEYPASYQLDNMITVAAIDPTGYLGSFSNYGKNTVDIAAPGVNVTSFTTKGLESWSGTSMAAPHVTGVAALLLSQDIVQPYSTIKNRLMASSRPLAGLRNRIRHGMLNANLALTNGVAGKDPDDPFDWTKMMVEPIATAHPYAMNTTSEWKVALNGAKRISIYFTNFDTEAIFDKLEFVDDSGKVLATMTGNLGETYSPVIESDHVTLRFTADDSNQGFGFEVGGIAFQ